MTAAALDELAARVQQGEPFSESDAALIVESRDLVAIGMISDELRRRLHGPDTTFVRVFEAHADAVPDALTPGTAAGEFRILGTPPSLDIATRTIERVRALAGSAPVFGFALHELEALDGAAELFRQLKQAGLDGIAEVALDCTSSAESIHAARAEGLLVLRATVHAAQADVAAFLARSRDLLAQAGGFRALAPLPRRLPVSNPTTGYDDVKAIALARLLLRDLPSIQVDWPLYGPKLAQVGLIAGADDVDGVSSAGAGILGTRRSPIEEIHRNIRAAGLVAVERDGRFERIGGTRGGARE